MIKIMVTLDEARSAFREAHAYLLKIFSFVALKIYNLNIIFTSNIDTAAVNDRELLINPEFFIKHSCRVRAFILAHEVYHIIFKDILRAKSRGLKTKEEWEVWNFVADGVNNNMLIKDGTWITADELKDLEPVTLNDIKEVLYLLGLSYEEQNLENMFKEEIYDLLKKAGKKVPLKLGKLGKDISYWYMGSNMDSIKDVG
jgi:predicted metal-dependent peptidase